MTALADRRAADPDAQDWVVLAAPSMARTRGERAPRLRDAVLQVVAVGLVLVALVGLVGAYVIKHLAEQQSVHDVAELTDVIAESVVQPALTDAMATAPSAARALERVLMPSMSTSPLVRIKLWAPDGTILYSDASALVGKKFALDDEAREAFSPPPRTTADVSDLKRPENRLERGNGKLLEVYRPVWTPSGKPQLLETYFRYDAVHQRSVGLWRGFAGILLSSIAALIVLMVPLVGYLLRRSRRAHEQKEQMARRALEASDEERRRIGASLHDGVVQQLVAASFDLSGRAQRARADGEQARAAELGELAATVRGTIGGLRSLLVEIYPPSVGTSGLPAALRDLSASVVGGRADVRLGVDDVAAARLEPTVQEEVFRVAQECLRNAVKHASAATIDLRLTTVAADRVRLEIADDGAGFDAARLALPAPPASRSPSAPGHLGLELVAAAARRCGAQLSVSSRPGHGARVRMDVPT